MMVPHIQYFQHSVVTADFITQLTLVACLATCRSFDDSSRTGDGRGGIPLYHDPHQFPEFTPNAMFGRPTAWP